jgi:Ca2+-binding RTX toxin-like protein
MGTSQLNVQDKLLTSRWGDSILAGDEVNADAKPVTLQLATRSSDAGPTVKFSGVVQLGFETPNPVASTKFLLAVIQGPAAVLGASQAHQSVVLSTPAGLFSSAGAGAGFGVNVSAGGSTTLVANGGKQDVSFVSLTGTVRSITATDSGQLLTANNENAPQAIANGTVTSSIKAIADLMGPLAVPRADLAVGSVDSANNMSSSSSLFGILPSSGPSFNLAAAPFSGQNSTVELTPVTASATPASTANTFTQSVVISKVIDTASKTSVFATPKISVETSASQFEEQTGALNGRVTLSFVGAMPTTIVVTLIGQDPRFPSERSMTVIVAPGKQQQDFSFKLLVLAETRQADAKASFELSQPVGSVLGDVISAQFEVIDKAPIVAGNANDQIVGAAGNDQIDAGGGDNAVSSFDGNDQVTSGSGNDTIDAGEGDNLISAGDGNNVVIAGSGNDTVTSGSGSDTVDAGAGNNEITTSAGSDSINAGAGNDVINAGDGTNTIDAGAGNNTVTAGSGSDTITTGNGTNTVEAGAGNNTVMTGTGADTITTGNGANTISAGAGDNRVTTGTGADSITAGAGNDVINAGDGTNTVDAGAGNNTVTSGAGSDTITTGNGANTVNAGAGDNTVTTGSGADTIEAAEGNDVINAGEGTNTISAGEGDNAVTAGAGNNTVSAGTGADTITRLRRR